jgi:hypothetical protein
MTPTLTVQRKRAVFSQARAQMTQRSGRSFGLTKGQKKEEMLRQAQIPGYTWLFLDWGVSQRMREDALADRKNIAQWAYLAI